MVPIQPTVSDSGAKVSFAIPTTTLNLYRVITVRTQPG